jgi:hypothetical protein
MIRIQIIAIITSILFLFYISRLIVKGKLREEYSIVWIIATILLVIFSFWRDGLDKMSDIFGVYEAPNLVFTGAIFGILVYLLHLSVSNSRLQHSNKRLAQEIALIKRALETKDEQPESISAGQTKEVI